MAKLATFTSGVNTSFSSELNGNQKQTLIIDHQNRIDTLRSITERTPTDVQADSQRDIFTDADGKNNTINTGNTTSHYNDSNYYELNYSITDTDDYNNSLLTTRGSPDTVIINCSTTESNVFISYVSIASGSNNATRYVAIKNSLGTTIARKDFTSHSPDYIAFGVYDYSELLNNESFSIVMYSYNESFYLTTSTHSYNGSLFSFSGQYLASNSDDNGTYPCIIHADQATALDTVVQTNTLATSGDNINSVFMTVQDEDNGSDKLTYDVSVDDGSTYTTDLSFNEINAITSTAGNDLVFKINIPGNVSSKLYGYSYIVGRVS